MSERFRHAVASFEPTDGSILLWTRLTGATEAEWCIATDPALTQVIGRGHATTGPERDHTIIVDVDGLEPATSYWYRFEAGGERSPVGRTRTLPAAPARDLRLGIVACARYSVAPLAVYRALAEREVDLVVHLGDYVYEDDGEKGPRGHRPPRMARTIDDYRQRLAQVREDEDCQALHLRHPMVLVLDDHDVGDNCWATGAKKHDEREDGPWRERVLAATTARQEWVPGRLRDPDDPTTTWRSIPIADLAELILLDTRLAGRDEQAGDPDSPGLHDPDRSLLGDEQRAWMEERLADVERPWALLVSGVVVNEISLPLPGTRVINPLLPNGYAALEGRVIHDDQWDGYPAERERLASTLGARGRRGGRTVILSGDIHSSWAFLGPRVDEQPVAIECTFPAVASKPMGRSRVPGAWRLLDGMVRRLEHVPWVDVTERGYGIVTVTPDDVTTEWRFVEATALDPAAGSWLGAAFRSARGHWPPRLERTEPTADPARPGLPAPLPPRPADAERLHRAHRRGRIAGTIGGVAAALTAATALAGLRRGRITTWRGSRSETG